VSRAPAAIARDWRAFVAAVEVRLAAGAKAYGNASLKRPPASLAGEVEEELLDVAGWGFLLWLRVRSLRHRLPASRRSKPKATGRKRT
jgi:hypothetical protein